MVMVYLTPYKHVTFFPNPPHLLIPICAFPYFQRDLLIMCRDMYYSDSSRMLHNFTQWNFQYIWNLLQNFLVFLYFYFKSHPLFSLTLLYKFYKSEPSNTTGADCHITSETTTWEESIKICQRSISLSAFSLSKENPRKNKICQWTLTQHFY